MLTILHPEVVPLINDLSTGLLPLLFGEESRTKLVVKAPKEVLLAAKVNNGFKLYVIPLVLSDRETIGLISAFFDDEDEPLVIFTPRHSCWKPAVRVSSPREMCAPGP